MENAMAKVEAKARRTAVGSILAFFVGLTGLVLVSMAGFHYFIAQPATKPLDRFAEVLSEVTQRQVQVSGSSVTLEEVGVSELAVVQRTTRSLIKYETSWLGSDNILIVRGDFHVRAGFDLSKVEKIGIRDNEIDGAWPQAEILSVELVDYEVFFSQNGVINKLKPKDQEKAIQRLLAQAREDVEKSDLKQEAERRLRERIEDLGQGDFTLGERFWP